MQIVDNFPQEHFVELRGLSPEFVGRLTIYQQGILFNLEIDIVQSESGKIYSHIKTLYNGESAREILELGVHYLKLHIRPKS